MLNEIVYALNKKLSAKGVHLYDSFSFKVKKDREALNAYGNIAVFQIHTGSLQLLDGNRGMTVEAVLHFAFRAGEETVSPTKIEDILDYLVADNNGTITDTADNQAASESEEPRDTFRYVFTFDMYKPVGEIKALSYNDMPDRYVMYDLPLQIIISKELMFGDDFRIYFQTDAGFMPLKNVVYWEEAPVPSFESPNFVNEGVQKNLFVAKSWTLKGKFMFDPDDPLCVTLEDNAHNAPDTVYSIQYELGGKVYSAEAYLSLSHSGSMRQFVAVDFVFHLQGNLTALSEADAAAIKEAWLI